MKTVIQASIYSVLANVIYHVVFPVVSGMLLTWMYVPDILDAQKMIGSGALQQEVTFGEVTSSAWWNTLPMTLLFGMIISYLCIRAFQRIKQARN